MHTNFIGLFDVSSVTKSLDRYKFWLTYVFWFEEFQEIDDFSKYLQILSWKIFHPVWTIRENNVKPYENTVDNKIFSQNWGGII